MRTFQVYFVPCIEDICVDVLVMCCFFTLHLKTFSRLEV